MKTFEEEFAVSPKRALEDAKLNLKKYVDCLFPSLPKQEPLDISDVACERIVYTGSAFEEVKVSTKLLEFDIMMIYPLDLDYFRAKELSTPGYYYIVSNDYFVDPQPTLAGFFSMLQKLINKHQDMSRLVKLCHHGPAVQMDVYREEEKREGSKWYSFDVVMACEVKIANETKRRIFVAKPLKSDSYAWRISYSLEEKELFENMDRDNGCRKQVLRILKAWCYKMPEMRPLTSYHLKTVLLHEVKAETDWSQDKLCLRVCGCLIRLHIALKAGILRHYFIRPLNLLYRLQSNKLQTKGTIENMKNRLAHILESSGSYYNAFNLIQMENTSSKKSDVKSNEKMVTVNCVYDDNYERAPINIRAYTTESLATTTVVQKLILTRWFSAPEGLEQWSS